MHTKAIPYISLTFCLHCLKRKTELGFEFDTKSVEFENT